MMLERRPQFVLGGAPGGAFAPADGSEI